jgi:ribulose-5-phosphate 4-epimerase/fuculose-1-phosphate aldolase
MKKQKMLIVGGSYGNKASSVVRKIAEELKMYKNLDITVINGFDEFTDLSVKGFPFIIWMPDFPNSMAKVYPEKDKGAVLICSKRMRTDTTKYDAVTRIFKMHGNAVLAIDNNIGKCTKLYTFTIYDALGNIWTCTDNIVFVVRTMLAIRDWTLSSTRVSIPQGEEVQFTITPNLEVFTDCVHKLAKYTMKASGIRMFGNASTRCMKLFPSAKTYGGILVSARNIDKEFIGLDDFVPIIDGKACGNKKPSIDTPIHLALYKRFPQYNYMIHGHAFIDSAPFTDKYVPCGDLREVEEISRYINRGYSVINLKNHGFIILTHDLDEVIHITDLVIDSIYVPQ